VHWLGLIRGVTIAQAEAMARHLCRALASDRPRRPYLAEAGELSGIELEAHWREGGVLRRTPCSPAEMW
jgi:hypothetical protein